MKIGDSGIDRRWVVVFVERTGVWEVRFEEIDVEREGVVLVSL